MCLPIKKRSKKKSIKSLYNKTYDELQFTRKLIPPGGGHFMAITLQLDLIFVIYYAGNKKNKTSIQIILVLNRIKKKNFYYIFFY